MGGAEMARKRVTLREVAAASGVSRATAGFVLSDAPNISIPETTRERVRQAARDLGYVPHAIARALREGSSRIVVLHVDVALDGNYAHSYIRGLEDELAAHDHALFVRYEHAGHAPGTQALDAIAPRAVLRLASGYLDPGHEYDDGGWSGGLAGNVLVQLRYLVSRGHTRIAVALPDCGQPLGPVRTRFAAEAARILGIPPPGSLVVPRDRAAAARSIETLPPSVTAVAAFDDEVALRVLAALRDLGRSAPDDLAVIGFDDTPYGELSAPALTTVHIDAEDHGRKTGRVILGLDSDGFSAAPATVIVRDSA
jgi:DNA-binding LacI/PurR family transcriptional regulator